MLSPPKFHSPVFAQPALTVGDVNSARFDRVHGHAPHEQPTRQRRLLGATRRDQWLARSRRTDLPIREPLGLPEEARRVVGFVERS